MNIGLFLVLVFRSVSFAVETICIPYSVLLWELFGMVDLDGGIGDIADCASDDPYGGAQSASNVSRSANHPSLHPTAPTAKRLVRPVASEAFFDELHLRCARSTTTRLEMPWERGFAAKLFNTGQNKSWPFGVPPMQQLVQLESRQALTEPIYVLPIPKSASASAVKRVVFAKIVPSEDAIRERAITRWRMFLESDLEASNVGQQLLQAAEALAPTEEIQEMLANIFSNKKTPTLYKRINDLMLYLAWSRTIPVFRPLLFPEPHVYQYVRHLMEAKAAPTKATAFREALVLQRHMLGCESAQQAIDSTRVKGACVRQYKAKRKLKQAEEFRVAQLRVLESMTCYASSDPDRCAAGFFTFLTMSSSRGHDAMHAEECTVEYDDAGACSMILGTANVKTATTEKLQTQLLPLMAFAPALLDKENWISAWLAARKRCKLQFAPGVPVLPAMGTHGQFIDRPCTNGELIHWMRELIRLGGAVANSVTVHSCKRTMLIWAAKYGAPVEDRRLLGHHVHPTVKSVLTYSKEALTGPMTTIWSMLQEIKAGTFDPESAPISRIKRARANTNQTSQASSDTRPRDAAIATARDCSVFTGEGEREVGLESNVEASADAEQSVSEDSNSSSSSDSSSDLSESDFHDPKEESKLLEEAGFEPSFQLAELSDHDVVQHNVSGVLHYRNIMDAAKLKCGRTFNASYSVISNKLQFDWPKCQQCHSTTVHNFSQGPKSSA